jgi:hypothetical protein
LIKRDKNNAILFELQELNESFNNLKDLISNSKEISEIKDNLELLDRFDNISENITKTNVEIKKLTERKLPTPNVIIPKKLEISNIEKAKADDVKIDWNNAPKQEKTDVSTPIKWLYKALESVVSDFFGKVISFMGKVLEYILEPDRIVVTDNNITEYYGNKKVVYKIKDDGRQREVIRET